MKEQWKPISGYEGLYEVSDLGRVKSFDRIDKIGRLHKGRVLKAAKEGGGYSFVSLFRNGVRSHKKVHQLVAEAFLGKCPNGYEVNHIDENKSNNSCNNLEYVTRHENLVHGTRMKRIADKLKKPIKCTNLATGEITIYPSITDASKDASIGEGRTFKMKRSNIGHAINDNHGHMAYGCKWEKVNE